jgi:hypothetical protein
MCFLISGVHLCTNLADVKRIAGSMLGQKLVTKQTVRFQAPIFR